MAWSEGPEDAATKLQVLRSIVGKLLVGDIQLPPAPVGGQASGGGCSGGAEGALLHYTVGSW